MGPLEILLSFCSFDPDEIGREISENDVVKQHESTLSQTNGTSQQDNDVRIIRRLLYYIRLKYTIFYELTKASKPHKKSTIVSRNRAFQ